MENYSIERIIEELNQLQDRTNNQLELESVQLLQQELQLETPRQAIIIGLISILEKNDSFNWITLYLKNQFS